MSSSGLTLVTSFGTQPTSSNMARINTAAFARTAVLASQSTLSSSILSAVGGGQHGQASSSNLSQEVAALQAQANAACAAGDRQQCSILNQQLAGLTAASTCPGGTDAVALGNRKQQGSLDAWFYPPTLFSAQKPIPDDVAAVAITLGAIQG